MSRLMGNHPLTRESSSQQSILARRPSRPSSPESKPTTAKLVNLEPWHFYYFLDEEEADSLSGRALGKTLMSASGNPLGFGGAYFEENERGETIVIVFFYGGPNGYFAKKYLPLVIRTIYESAKALTEMSVETVYAVCDRRVEGAEKFIRWAGGQRVDGADDPHGPIYAIKLSDLRVMNR